MTNQTQLADFAFEVMCTRARRRYKSLDSATLRGLMSRSSLRPRDLRVLGADPVSLLNRDEGTEQEHAAFSELLARAIEDRLASQPDDEARQRLANRLERIVADIQAHTPYIIEPPEPEPEPEPSVSELEPITADMLRDALAPWEGRGELPEAKPIHNPPRPMYKSLRANVGFFNLPPRRPDLASRMMSLTFLSESLAPLITPPAPDVPPIVAPPRPWFTTPILHLPLVREPPTGEDILLAASLDHQGEDIDRWLGMTGAAIGLSGVGMGVGFVIWGIYSRNLVMLFGGLSLVIIALLLDFVIEVARGRRVEDRKRVMSLTE